MTFEINCPCGCGQVVEASDAGFAATSCEVAACPSLRAQGIVATTIRKSAAYSAAVPSTVLRHREGLVTFG